MKLPKVKQSMKLGLLAMLPVVVSCAPEHETAIVVAKRLIAQDPKGNFQSGNLYLDIDGDSLADMKFYISTCYGFFEEQQIFYDYIQPGDTIDYVFKSSNAICIKRVNSKTHKAIQHIAELARIRSEINQPQPER